MEKRAKNRSDMAKNHGDLGAALAKLDEHLATYAGREIVDHVNATF